MQYTHNRSSGVGNDLRGAELVCWMGGVDKFEVSDLYILLVDSIFWILQGVCECRKEFCTTKDNVSVDCFILFSTIFSVVPHLHSQLFVLPPIMLVNVAVGW